MAKKKKTGSYLDQLAGGSLYSADPAGPAEADDDAGPCEDLPTTGNHEKDEKAEAAFVLSALDQSEAQVEKVIDPHYYLRLIFVTADQAKEFLKKTGWDRVQVGDVPQRCVDGLAVARMLGVELTPEAIPFRGQRTEKRIGQTGIVPGYPA
jgi:hypothetical protein